MYFISIQVRKIGRTQIAFKILHQDDKVIERGLFRASIFSITNVVFIESAGMPDILSDNGNDIAVIFLRGNSKNRDDHEVILNINEGKQMFVIKQIFTAILKMEERFFRDKKSLVYSNDILCLGNDSLPITLDREKINYLFGEK